MNRDFRVRVIHRVLLAAYGRQGWWPGTGPFETVVGAILTQNTSWKNVERALARLRGRGALAAPRALARLAPDEIMELIRPAGFARAKSGTLREISARIARSPGGLTGFLSADGAVVRRALLEIRGIGPETADAILLYAAGRPAFVVDAYTRRLVDRHHIAHGAAPYADLKRMFEQALPPSASVLNEYHALIVRLGKTCCRAVPECDGCPLAWDLPGASRGRARPRS